MDNISEERLLEILENSYDLQRYDSECVLSNKAVVPFIQSVEQKAREFEKNPIPVITYSTFKLFNETGDRTEYEDGPAGYFPRRGRLAVFAVLSFLYKRPEDIQRLEDVIWAICDEYTWCLPAHLPKDRFGNVLEDDIYTVDLFAAETAQSLSEISFILGDLLSPIIRLRIADILDKRIFKIILSQRFDWVGGPGNWTAVCAGSVGMAAIYACENDKPYMAKLLCYLLSSFDRYLNGFTDEGACLEGISYWTYGFSYFVSFAELLYRRTLGAVDMFSDKRASLAASFQQKCFLASGVSVAFADGSDNAWFLSGLTCFLKKRYEGIVMPPLKRIADINSDHCYRFSNIFRNIIWTDSDLEDTKVFGCYMLRSAQWLICSSPSGYEIAAKGGHNCEPHNHNDVGSFMLVKDGTVMLPDLGAGEYSRQYFSGTRYDFFVCGSQGHSLPMIDGRTQVSKSSARARDTELYTEDSIVGIRMDISQAYDMDTLSCLLRDIRFDKECGGVILHDTFIFNGGRHSITERFIALGEIQIYPDHVAVIYSDRSICIYYDGKLFVPSTSKVVFNRPRGIASYAYTIDFTVNDVQSMDCSFTIK